MGYVVIAKVNVNLGKTKDISDLLRGMIVGVRTANTSISEMTALLGIFSPNCISGVYRVSVEEKITSSDKDCSGRKNLVNMRGEKRAARIAPRNKRETTLQITAEFNAGGSQGIFQRATRWTSQRMGFCSTRPLKVP